MKLVAYETWPSPRPGDLEWQEKILKYLERRASPEHIIRIKEDIGTVRFRPEEVAASAALKSIPAVFKDCEDAAVSVLRMLAHGA
ncbi:MAG TPA: hypothetical protein VIS99_04960 [Terrimicrobiaceae bacterium]